MKITCLRVLVFGFSLRVFVAFWNGFLGSSLGADLDALTFHLQAVKYAGNSTLDPFSIGWIYTYVLGLLYYVTTDSLFIGCLLSCLAWLWSAQVLLSCTRILKVERSEQVKVILIYALLPSSIMFTSITLREPFQLLFVNLAIYAILKIYIKNNSKHWFTLIAAIIFASSLHGALLAFGVILFLGVLLLTSMHGKVKISWLKIGLMGFVGLIILWYGFSSFSNVAYNLDDGLDNSIQNYQQSLLSVDARTHYKEDTKISGLSGLLFFIPLGFFQYLFEPFPWHVSAASDVIVLFENILRGYLIFKAWKVLKIAIDMRQKILILILFSYLILELIWSIGTINWGTSIRHHLPAWGLLLLAAYASLNQKYIYIKK